MVDSLPPHVAAHILSHLTAEQVFGSVSRVSRGWRRLAYFKPLHKALIRQPRHNNPLNIIKNTTTTHHREARFQATQERLEHIAQRLAQRREQLEPVRDFLDLVSSAYANSLVVPYTFLQALLLALKADDELPSTSWAVALIPTLALSVLLLLNLLAVVLQSLWPALLLSENTADRGLYSELAFHFTTSAFARCIATCLGTFSFVTFTVLLTIKASSPHTTSFTWTQACYPLHVATLTLAATSYVLSGKLHNFTTSVYDRGMQWLRPLLFSSIVGVFALSITASLAAYNADHDDPIPWAAVLTPLFVASLFLFFWPYYQMAFATRQNRNDLVMVIGVIFSPLILIPLVLTEALLAVKLSDSLDASFLVCAIPLLILSGLLVLYQLFTGTRLLANRYNSS